MDVLKRDSHVSMYMQLAQKLESDIKTGRYRPFERLPTAKQLAEEYQISRITITQALDILSQQGLVIRKQGKGTFVSGPATQHDLEHIKGIGDGLIEQGFTPEFELIQFEPVTPQSKIKDILELDDQEVVCLKRIYLLNSKAFAYTVSYLPSIAKEISFQDAEKHSALSILEDILEIRIARADASIKIVSAGSEIGKLLKVKSNTKLMSFERLYYSKLGTKIAFSEFYLLPEEYHFEINVLGPLPIGSAIKKSN
jgi:GntR family transcriptional regulator